MEAGACGGVQVMGDEEAGSRDEPRPHTWTQRGGSGRWERCKCSGLRPWAAPLTPTLEPKEAWPLLEKKPPVLGAERGHQVAGGMV